MFGKRKLQVEVLSADDSLLPTIDFFYREQEWEGKQYRPLQWSLHCEPQSGLSAKNVSAKNMFVTSTTSEHPCVHHIWLDYQPWVPQHMKPEDQKLEWESQSSRRVRITLTNHTLVQYYYAAYKFELPHHFRQTYNTHTHNTHTQSNTGDLDIYRLPRLVWQSPLSPPRRTLSDGPIL